MSEQDTWMQRAVYQLRTLRKQAGLTQAEVAKRLGTKQSAIARLEASEGNISLETFVRFAVACGYMPLNLELAAPLEVEAREAEQRRLEVLARLQEAYPNSVPVPFNPWTMTNTVGPASSGKPLPPCAA